MKSSYNFDDPANLEKYKPKFNPIAEGWRAGVEQTKGLLGGGAPMLAADALLQVAPNMPGAEAVKDFSQSRMGYYQDKMQETEKYAVDTDTLDKIEFSKPGGVGRLGEYVGQAIGKGLPSVATSVLGGGFGGALAQVGVKGAVKQAAKGFVKAKVGDKVEKVAVSKAVQAAAKDRVKKAGAIGAGLGYYATSAGMEGGGAYGEMRGEGLTPEQAVVPALAVAGIAGLLDTLPIGLAAKKLGGAFNPAKAIRDTIKTYPDLAKKARHIAAQSLKGAGVGALAEGPTEAMQELVQIAGMRWAKGQEVFAELSDEEIMRAFESGVQGMLVGKAVGGASGAAVGTAEAMRQAPPVRGQDVQQPPTQQPSTTQQPPAGPGTPPMPSPNAGFGEVAPDSTYTPTSYIGDAGITAPAPSSTIPVEQPSLQDGLPPLPSPDELISPTIEPNPPTTGPGQPAPVNIAPSNVVPELSGAEIAADVTTVDDGAGPMPPPPPSANPTEQPTVLQTEPPTHVSVDGELLWRTEAGALENIRKEAVLEDYAFPVGEYNPEEIQAKWQDEINRNVPTDQPELTSAPPVDEGAVVEPTPQEIRETRKAELEQEMADINAQSAGKELARGPAQRYDKLKEEYEAIATEEQQEQVAQEPEFDQQEPVDLTVPPLGETEAKPTLDEVVAADPEVTAEPAAKANDRISRGVSPFDIQETEQDSEYVYHATNAERADEISAAGILDTFEPSYGTEQDFWPDGSIEKRSYWRPDSKSTGSFAPEEGKPVVLRAKRSELFKEEWATEDVYSTAPVKATDLEILTDKGWEPLVEETSTSDKQPATGDQISDTLTDLADGVGPSARADVAERIRKGDNPTFTKPESIALAESDPAYNTETQDDGTVKVVGVQLEDGTWEGIAPELDPAEVRKAELRASLLEDEAETRRLETAAGRQPTPKLTEEEITAMVNSEYETELQDQEPAPPEVTPEPPTTPPVVEDTTPEIVPEPEVAPKAPVSPEPTVVPEVKPTSDAKPLTTLELFGNDELRTNKARELDVPVTDVDGAPLSEYEVAGTIVARQKDVETLSKEDADTKHYVRQVWDGIIGRSYELQELTDEAGLDRTAIEDLAYRNFDSLDEGQQQRVYEILGSLKKDNRSQSTRVSVLRDLAGARRSRAEEPIRDEDMRFWDEEKLIENLDTKKDVPKVKKELAQYVKDRDGKGDIHTLTLMANMMAQAGSESKAFQSFAEKYPALAAAVTKGGKNKGKINGGSLAASLEKAYVARLFERKKEVMKEYEDYWKTPNWMDNNADLKSIRARKEAIDNEIQALRAKDKRPGVREHYEQQRELKQKLAAKAAESLAGFKGLKGDGPQAARTPQEAIDALRNATPAPPVTPEAAPAPTPTQAPTTTQTTAPTTAPESGQLTSGSIRDIVDDVGGILASTARDAPKELRGIKSHASDRVILRDQGGANPNYVRAQLQKRGIQVDSNEQLYQMLGEDTQIGEATASAETIAPTGATRKFRNNDSGLMTIELRDGSGKVSQFNGNVDTVEQGAILGTYADGEYAGDRFAFNRGEVKVVEGEALAPDEVEQSGLDTLADIFGNEPEQAPTSEPAPAPKPPKPTKDDVEQSGFDALDEFFGDSPAPTQSPSPNPSPAPRPQSEPGIKEPGIKETGASAVRNTRKGLGNVARGLGELLSKPPGTLGMGLGFSPETYAKAKPYFMEAWAYFGDAAKDAKQLIKLLVRALAQEFGFSREQLTELMPYMAQFAKDVEAGLITKPPQQADPDDVRKSITTELLNGTDLSSIAAARKLVGDLLGAEIKPSTLEAKGAEELIEQAGVMAARQIVRDNGPMAAYDALVDLQNRMPVLSSRTSKSSALQAFSTPLPLAFVAGRFAAVNKAKAVLEPTGGNGALVMEAEAGKVTANEIDQDRAAFLKEQQFSVTTKDASVAESLDGMFDSIVTNPPFGGVLDKNGGPKIFDLTDIAEQFTTGQIDQAISLRALEHLEADGKAVLIIGSIPESNKTPRQRSDAYNTLTKRKFFHTLYNGYNVTDHFTVAGDMYKKMGAGWPVDVIVIEGRGKSARSLPAADVPRQITSYEELRDELERNERRPSRGKAGGATGGGGRSGGGGGGTGGTSGRSGGGTSGGTKNGVTKRNGRGPTGISGGNGSTAGNTNRTPQRNQLPDGADLGTATIENTFQAPYPKRSKKRSVDSLIPVNMQTSVKEALDKIEAKYGDIDTFVGDKLNYTQSEVDDYFSAEQVDALALALDNIDDGRGFIIGDQTGVGKGRIVAGLMRYAMIQGQIPVFLTEKANLYADIMRDLTDIGMPEFNPLVTNRNFEMAIDEEAIAWTELAATLKKMGEPQPEKEGRFISSGDPKKHEELLQEIADTGELQDFDGIFSTYSQVQSQKQEEVLRHEVIRAIGPNAMLLLDESHNAGGAAGTKGSSTMLDASGKAGRAGFLRQVIRTAKSVFYSSATYAKRPDVMDLYIKTDIGLGIEAGLISAEELAQALTRYGTPLQQVVANMLSKAGQYLRREKSFDGISYDTQEAPVDHVLYENTAEIMRDIIRFDQVKGPAVQALDDAAKAEAKSVLNDGTVGAASADSMGFTSKMHNFLSQFLLSLKVEAGVDRALEALANGEKPVLTVSNTMGKAIQDYVRENGISPDEAIDITFESLLHNYLKMARQIVKKDAFGFKTKRQMTDDELGPVAAAFYDRIETKLLGMGFEQVPASPIDRMHQMLRDKGYETDEITGREHTIDYSKSQPAYKKRPLSNTSPAGKNRIIRKFNNGQTDVLIVNQSGATGLSLHAGEKFTDQRRRAMILVQPELNIDTHMQMLGRINRTGQVTENGKAPTGKKASFGLPRYEQLLADVPGEYRPAAVLARKMASLNANTTAAKSSALTAKGVPDFLNKYGDSIAAQFLEDNPEIHKRLAYPVKVDDKGQLTRDAAMQKLSGRIPILPLVEQEEIYGELIDAYSTFIETATRMGENDLEAQTLELDAKVSSSLEIIAPLKDNDSPFAAGVDAETLDVKMTGKSLTWDEANDLVQQTLNGTKQDWIDNLQKDFNAQVAVFKAALEVGVDKTDQAAMDKVADRQKDVDVQASRVNTFASQFAPGTPVTIASGQGQTMVGVVTDFGTTGRSKNPASPGTWNVTIAVADAARSIKVPLSRVSSVVDAGMMAILPTAQNDVELAFVKGQSQSRESRIMLTGNLLSAATKFGGKGQIVHYTDEMGAIQQGILMPRKFNLQEEISKMDSVFIDESIAEDFITQTPGVAMGVKGVRGFLLLDTGDGNYALSVPSAKRAGSKWFLNQDLMDAAGGAQFVKGGTQFRMTFPANKLTGVLQELYKTGVKLKANSFKEEAREFINDRLRNPVPSVEFSFPMEERKVTEEQIAQELDAELGEGWTQAAIDAELLTIIDQRGPDGASGYYNPATGKIVLYTKSMPADGSIAAVALHEGGHAKLFDVLGPAYEVFHADLLTLAKNGNKAAQAALERSARAGAKTYGIVHALDTAESQEAFNAELTRVRKELKKRNKALLMEEDLGYFIQEAKDSEVGGGLFRRLVNAIKAWWTQTALGQALKANGLGVTMTNDLAIKLAQESLRQSLKQAQMQALLSDEKIQSDLVKSVTERLGDLMTGEVGWAVPGLYSFAGAQADTAMSKAENKRKKFNPEATQAQGDPRGYTPRMGPPPKKTKTVYKAFRQIGGKLYPMFVGAAHPLPQGEWLDATEGGYHFTAANGRAYTPTTQQSGMDSVAIPNDEVRQELVALGYISPTSKARDVRVVAYRPGWHGGDLPFFPQSGISYAKTLTQEQRDMLPGYPYKHVHNNDTVIAEVEIDADQDFKDEYEQTAVRSEKGKIMPKLSGLKRIPKGGFYEYATNQMFQNRPDLGKWYISGSMKIARILTRDEANTKMDEAGVPRQVWADEVGLFSKPGITERRWWYTDPLDSNQDEYAKPGFINNLVASYVDYFDSIRKKSKEVYDTYDLARSIKSAKLDYINRTFLEPMEQLIHDSKWNATEVGDILAARSMRLDDGNRKTAVRHAKEYIGKLLATGANEVLPLAERNQLKKERDFIDSQNRDRHGMLYKDANGNVGPIPIDVQREMLGELVDDYVARAKDRNGEQQLKEDWEALNDYALGFSEGGRAGAVAQIRKIDDIYTQEIENDPQFQKIAELFDRLNRHALQVRVDGGVIQQIEMDRMIKDKPHYAPLRREPFDLTDEVSRLMTGNRKGIGGLKTRAGTTAADMEPVHVLQNAFAQAHAAVSSAERNNANNTFYEHIMEDKKNQTGIWDSWFKTVTVDKQPRLDEKGYVKQVVDLSIQDTDIVLVRKGKRIILRPETDNLRAVGIGRAVNNMDAQNLEGPYRIMQMVNNLIRFVNISASPAFLLANAIRDPLTAGLNMQASEAAPHTRAIFNNYKRTLKALKKVYIYGVRDPADPDVRMVEKWEAAGGRISFVESLKEMDGSWKGIESKINMRKGKFGGAIGYAENQLRKIENLNIMMENVMRLSTFDVLTREGMSEQDAARIAKDLTTNFTRRGYKTQVLGVWWLFFNATVQGNWQVGLNLAKSKKLQAATGALVMGGFMVEMMAAAMGDDDWDDISDWEKERNIVSPFKTFGVYAKVPSPWVFNVFWRMGGMMGEMVRGVRTPQQFVVDLAAMVHSTFNPIGSSGTLLQALSPTAADPFMQIVENRSFSGAPLGPTPFPGMSKVPDSQLAWSSTPEAYKMFAEMVNEMTGGTAEEAGLVDLQPAAYKVMVDTVIGSLGKFAIQVGDTGWSGVVDGEWVGADKAPILRQLTATPSDRMDTQLYHERVAKVYAAERLVKRYTDGPERDFQKLREVRTDRAGDLRMLDYAKDVERQLREIRKTLKAAQARGQDRRVEVLEDRIAELRKRFNNSYARRVGN